MSQKKPGKMSLKQVQILAEQFNSSMGLPFQKLLPSSMIEDILIEEKIPYRNRIFNPIVTLWAFLSQVLDTDKSCHNAVSRMMAWLKGQGEEAPSSNTSAYCQARQRLSEKFMAKLFRQVGKKLEEETPPSQLWCGRHVKVFDGSTVSMPDTEANQKAYPQPNSQKKGCGFPLAKIGVLFSLTTGACVDLALDAFQISEVKLARQLYAALEAGDVWLSDRGISSYADLYFLKNCLCDAVVRLHQSRKQELRKGKRIGPNDRLVTWNKPKSRPQGLTPEEFSSLPSCLTLREIHYYICIPGFRTKEVTLITTLLDGEIYSSSALARLYELRWEVELDLRHLKTTLGMDILRSKTPEMVRKEIYAYLLAYNLLRTVMWSAGTKAEVDPLRLSLQGTRHHFNNFGPELKNAAPQTRQKLYQEMLNFIARRKIAKTSRKSLSQSRQTSDKILSEITNSSRSY